jgi:heme O synthase-like polyprenyltransferase
MARTRARPLPRGDVGARSVLAFASVLGAAAWRCCWPARTCCARR